MEFDQTRSLLSNSSVQLTKGKRRQMIAKYGGGRSVSLSPLIFGAVDDQLIFTETLRSTEDSKTFGQKDVGLSP